MSKSTKPSKALVKTAVSSSCSRWERMNNIEIKKAGIGKVGFFFNEEDEKTHKIGRLVSVTKNGNCEDEDQTYYDNFTPMKRADLLECIDLEFFS